VPDRRPGLWWARLPLGRESGRRTLAGVLSDEFPADSVVDLPGDRRPPRWLIAVVAEDGSRVRAVEVALPDAPLLWYVDLAEASAAPPATTLVAFSDARFAEGTVLTAAEARAAGVGSGEQVGALRWWTGTGLVHQLYVGPAHRRRGVALKLAHAASGVQAARGLPPLHDDGRRTDLGEQWRRGLAGYAAARFAPLSQLLAPMTPG
jgi:GNAT superfamily N-acetyltransferase